MPHQPNASISHTDQIVAQLLHGRGGRTGLHWFWVMGDEYGLLRFDDDDALLALFAVKTSLVRLYGEEFLRGDTEALRLNLLDVFLVGERGDDRFDFGGRNLQQTEVSGRSSSCLPGHPAW